MAVYMYMMIKSTILVLITAIAALQHSKGALIKVQGNVNQSVNILIPFKHLISLTIDQPQYNEIFVFSPNRFRLQPINDSLHLPKSNKTLLQQLTSPFTNQYLHLLRLKPYFLVFKMPNHFYLLQETQQKLIIYKQFSIASIKSKDLKFQMVNEQTIIVFLSSSKVVFVRSDSYLQANNMFNTTHVVFSRPIGKELQTFAYFSNQMHKVSFEGGQLALKQEIILSSQLKEVRSILVQSATSALWIVDANIGLVWMKTNNNNHTTNDFMFLLQHKGCYQMDLKIEQQVKVLLTCSWLGQSFFVKALYRYQKQKPVLIKQWSPHIEQCKTKKFLFFNQHIFSLQKQSLDIFLPSIYKGQAELLYTKNWIGLPPQSSYLPQQQQGELYIYSLHNSQFSKNKLILEDYTLQINTEKELQTNLNLTVEYFCSQNYQAVKEICVHEVQVQVNIHSKNLSFTQARSMNIGIMLLFGTCLLAIGFICFVKYRRMQEKVGGDLKALTNPNNFKL